MQEEIQIGGLAIWTKIHGTLGFSDDEYLNRVYCPAFRTDVISTETLSDWLNAASGMSATKVETPPMVYFRRGVGHRSSTSWTSTSK